VSYIRINYITAKDANSSAYFDPDTSAAYDVFNQRVLNLSRDPLTGFYSENGRKHAPASQPVSGAPVASTPVVLYPYYHKALAKNPLLLLWLAIPIAFYGIVGIFISLSFRH
jgi:hypothetical protein